MSATKRFKRAGFAAIDTERNRAASFATTGNAQTAVDHLNSGDWRGLMEALEWEEL